jgi:RNA-directed DNA polymerase
MLDILKQLHAAYGFGHLHLEELIRRAPLTYKFFTIPKRTGGARIIAHPAKETKTIQRWIAANVLSNLPIHDCATAYAHGCSIKKNALLHSKNTYLVKLDLSNFFNSIKFKDVRKLLVDRMAEMLNEDDIERIAQVCCVKMPGERELCLSVGAPSSPLLSNSMMYEFDCLLEKWCTDAKITYSRYADDLTFSTNQREISSTVQPFVEQALARLNYPRLQINPEKSVHSSRKFQRRVTGLVIANDNTVSLGRERKREISALIHQFGRTQLPEKEIYRLQGLLGLAKDVEPSFLIRMSAKYSSKLLSEIFAVRKPKRIVRTITIEDILSGTFD